MQHFMSGDFASHLGQWRGLPLLTLGPYAEHSHPKLPHLRLFGNSIVGVEVMALGRFAQRPHDAGEVVSGAGCLVAQEGERRDH